MTFVNNQTLFSSIYLSVCAGELIRQQVRLRLCPSENDQICDCGERAVLLSQEFQRSLDRNRVVDIHKSGNDPITKALRVDRGAARRDTLFLQ